MRRLVAAACLLQLLAASQASAQFAHRTRLRVAPRTTGSLARRISRLLDEAPFDRALWGVAIANPSGTVVYERNGDRLFVPASNAKLIVSATAVALLPRDFRYRTSLYAGGPVADTVLRGDLVLYGRGDPTLSDRFYPNDFTPFMELADSLQARGITRITGDLVADASYFDAVTVHPSWESYDLTWWYAAPVSALGFNENTVDVHITPLAPGVPAEVTVSPDLGLVRFTDRSRVVDVDAPRTFDLHRVPGTNEIWADGDLPVDTRPWTENVSIAEGALWAGAAMKHALERAGITLMGTVRATYDPRATAAARGTAPLAEHLSPPIGEVLQPVLQQSHNWYAEMLLKTLGREIAGTGSWEAGLEVERRFLIDSLGVDSTQFHLADGSGLSHWNLITPQALVQLLYAVYHRPHNEDFLSALAVGGSSGTLKNRYRTERFYGRVHAKTGSIANVNTLSGYLETRSGPWTFSIQLNNHAAKARDALKRIDAIVTELEK